MIHIKILIVAFCLCGAFSLDSHAQGDRIIGHSHYRTLDTSGFYLYSINKLVQGEKIARPQTVYYFSKGAGDPVQELTLANLEQAFAANTDFRYRLEAQFHSDKELIAYDRALNTYKIEYLYRESSR